MVHQGAAGPTWWSASRSRWTSTLLAASARSPSGEALRAPGGAGAERARSTGRTSSARARRASRTASTATCRTPAGGLLIDNLPADCCVEVPCVASRGRDRAPGVGSLPRHLAGLMQSNVNVQGLVVEAALSGGREPVYHAAMLDPHTAGELPLDEIPTLVDALIEAHGDAIP